MSGATGANAAARFMPAGGSAGRSVLGGGVL